MLLGFNHSRRPFHATDFVFVLTLIVVAFAALALRWADLGRESLWFDEGYTAWMVGHTPGEIVRLIRADTAPPLYYLMLAGWVRVLGDSETALRALSAGCASVSLLLTLLLARRFTSSKPALLLTLMLAGVSMLQIQYAREARFYALMLLESTALLYAIVRWRESDDGRWTIPIVLLSACSLYTNNAMLFTLIAACGFAVLIPGMPKRRLPLHLSLVVLGTGLLYAPWLPVFIEQSRAVGGNFWITTPTTGDLLGVLSNLAGTGNYLAAKAVVGAIGLPESAEAVTAVTLACVTIIWTAGFVCASATERRVLSALLFFCLFPPLALFSYSLVRQPIFMAKPLIVVTPALVLSLVLCVQIAWKRRASRVVASLSVMMLGTLCVASTVGFLTEETKEDWRGAARYVASLPPASRVLVFVAAEGQLPFDYYDRTRRSARTGAPGGFFDVDPPRTLRRVTSDADLTALRALFSNTKLDEIILVRSHDGFADPDGRTEREIASKGRLVETTELRLITLNRYEIR